MDEQALEEYLQEVIGFAAEADEDDGLTHPTMVHTLGESEFLTRDKGLHLKFADGSEWVVSIGCYRRPREEPEDEE
jgi:hypothetical protein